jgi:type II secretory pathway component PulF
MKLPVTSKIHKLSESDKLGVVEGLSIMLNAGIPILEALESIADDMIRKNAKVVVKGLSDEISSGKTLSEAMQKYPDSFDPVLISIVKSGEASGNLDKVLSHVADNIKASIDTANNIKSALFYPILVVVALIGVSVFAFTYSLPRVAEVFLDLKINLPFYSSFVLKSSLFFKNYVLYFAAGFLISIFLAVRLLMVTKFRRSFFSFLTKIPSIKTLIKFMDLSRFTNTSSLLLTAGVPIIEVLDISKNVVISPKLKADIDYLKDSLAQGLNLSESMKGKAKSFPSLLRRVVGVGEETGNLDKTLADISDHYEKKFTDIIKNLTVMLEPILIVLIGFVVLIVLLAIIVPIYQVIGQLNPPQ